jgi:hypothetical protein
MREANRSGKFSARWCNKICGGITGCSSQVMWPSPAESRSRAGSRSAVGSKAISPRYRRVRSRLMFPGKRGSQSVSAVAPPSSAKALTSSGRPAAAERPSSKLPAAKCCTLADAGSWQQAVTSPSSKETFQTPSVLQNALYAWKQRQVLSNSSECQREPNRDAEQVLHVWHDRCCGLPGQLAPERSRSAERAGRNKHCCDKLPSTHYPAALACSGPADCSARLKPIVRPDGMPPPKPQAAPRPLAHLEHPWLTASGAALHVPSRAPIACLGACSSPERQWPPNPLGKPAKQHGRPAKSSGLASLVPAILRCGQVTTMHARRGPEEGEEAAWLCKDVGQRRAMPGT